MLSLSDEEMVKAIAEEIRASVQAGAYTMYIQTKSNSKNILTPREFHREFVDNWETFTKIELDGKD